MNHKKDLINTLRMIARDLEQQSLAVVAMADAMDAMDEKDTLKAIGHGIDCAKQIKDNCISTGHKAISLLEISENMLNSRVKQQKP